MIKKVTIKMDQSLICGGMAIVELDGSDNYVFFDVVKSNPLRVIVGSRGKNIETDIADVLEQELLMLFMKHQVPLQLGTFSVSA